MVHHALSGPITPHYLSSAAPAADEQIFSAFPKRGNLIGSSVLYQPAHRWFVFELSACLFDRLCPRRMWIQNTASKAASAMNGAPPLGEGADRAGT